MSKVALWLILVILVGNSFCVHGMKNEDSPELKSRPPLCDDPVCTLKASLRKASAYLTKQYSIGGTFSFDCIRMPGGQTISRCIFTHENGVKYVVSRKMHRAVEALLITACMRPCSLLLKKMFAGWTNGGDRLTPQILREECHALHDQTPLDYMRLQYGKNSVIYKTAVGLVNDWKNLTRRP